MSIRDFSNDDGTAVVGDGLRDNTTGIQKALDACSGQVLFVPPANPDSYYKITAGLNGASNCHIVGSGAAGEIRSLHSGPNDINMLTFDGKSNFVVENLTLRGAAKRGSFDFTRYGNGIFVIGNSSDFAIRNSTFVDMTEACVFLNAVAATTIQRADITGIHCDQGAASTNPDTYAADLMLYQAAGTIRQVKIIGNRLVSPNGHGIWMNCDDDAGKILDINISLNEIQGKLKHGIFTYRNAVRGPCGSSLVIANNIIRSVNWIGIYLQGSTKDVVISGNHIADAAHSVLRKPMPGWDTLPWAAIGTIDNAGVTQGLSIVGNVIAGFNGHSGIRMVGASDSVIANNTIGSDGKAQIFERDNGISVFNAHRVTVANNAIHLTGIEGGGIYIDGTAGGGGGPAVWQGNRIVGNSILSPNAAGISVRTQVAPQIVNNFVQSALAAGIVVSDTSDCLVQANQLFGGAGKGSRVRITAERATTDRCKVRDNILSDPATTGYGIQIESRSVSDTVVEGNELARLTISGSSKLVDTGVRTEVRRNRLADDPMYGTFNLGTSAATTVSNGNSLAVGRVRVWPINATAAVLMSSPKAVYINSVQPGDGFTVTTSDGSRPIGTERFGYEID